MIEQSVEISEKKEQVEEVPAGDFGKEGATHMKEMMGCSRNHSKEIDIYSKSYSEKIQRIISMKDEGNQSFKDGHYDKASYYYAQALLIFYYLIPDTDE